MHIPGSGGIAEGVAKEKGLALVGADVGVTEAEGRGVGEVAGEASRAHDLAAVDGMSAPGEGLHLPSRLERYGGLVVWIAQAEWGGAGEEAEKLSPAWDGFC